MATNNMYTKFESEIPKQTWATSQKKQNNTATRLLYPRPPPPPKKKKKINK